MPLSHSKDDTYHVSVTFECPNHGQTVRCGKGSDVKYFKIQAINPLI